jgi:hypothetical protein
MGEGLKIKEIMATEEEGFAGGTGGDGNRGFRPISEL